MKKRKWLLTALAAASVLACTVGFAACGDDTATTPPPNGDQADNDVQTHTHAWATAWSKDGTSHWHACSDCNEKKDKAPHDFTNGACVCGVTPSDGFNLEESADGNVLIKDMGSCTDTEIIIPNAIGGKSVTAIAPQAFSGNTSLKSIALPASVTSIGTEAFKDCTSLISVSVAENAVQTASYAATFAATFEDTDDTEDNEPVYEIGESAFAGCTSLVSIEIPYGITSIGYLAFEKCTSLKTVLIPDSVIYIIMMAFDSCSSLTEIAIPKSVKYIGPASFISCSSLTSINVDENNKSFSSENGILYDKDKTTLLRYPEGIQDTSFSISIPESMTYIDYYAFSGCSSLTNITIPDGVTEIRDCAFESCTSLTSVVIPNSVTDIGIYAFGYCTSLTSITIPNSVAEISEGTFWECTSLTSITFEGTRAQWKAILKGSNWDYHTGDYTLHCSDD